MSLIELAGSTAIVTGASRGFGRGIALALAGAGSHVVGVSRSESRLRDLQAELGEAFSYEVADVADPGLPAKLYARYQPLVVVLNAGAAPPPRQLDDQTWETFSSNWNVDVRQAFEFCAEALRAPLSSGAVVVCFSSGAALRGSPLSGGYAGSKATVKFISAYAHDESARRDLGIRFVSVLPQLTPTTDLGAEYVHAYASRAGMTERQYLDQLGSPLTPGSVGSSVLAIATDPSRHGPAYRLSSVGLEPID
jgi:NAD(P)-dependent dehydrogenase (short-subunit alcohol dehydrogenase family)